MRACGTRASTAIEMSDAFDAADRPVVELDDDGSPPGSLGGASPGASFNSDIETTHPVLSRSYTGPPQSWPQPPTEEQFTMVQPSFLDSREASGETFRSRRRKDPAQTSVLSLALAQCSQQSLVADHSVNDVERESDGWSTTDESHSGRTPDITWSVGLHVDIVGHGSGSRREARLAAPSRPLDRSPCAVAELGR